MHYQQYHIYNSLKIRVGYNMKMFISFSLIYSLFSILAFLFVFAIVVAHIYSKVKRPSPLRLTSDSIVLIVGGCMGIGKQMAIKIARQYHSTILLVDRRKQLFESVSKEIKKYNGICQCFLGDLSDLKAVDKMVENIKQNRKKIDLLIYNAGIVIPQYSWQTKQQNIHAVMNVNFFSPIKFINGLLPRLEGGHIAVVASVASIVDGGVQLSSYVASKHAIFGYLSCFRQQLKLFKKDITLSIGCPYAINTTLFQGFKTKMDKILPILDEKYVADRLVKQFIMKKQVCYIGRRHALVSKIFKFFPSSLVDMFLTSVNTSDFSKKKKAT